MSTAALGRDAFAPRQPPGMRSGLALALGVHALLILALAWSVNWKSSEPDGIEAELWSSLPQIAAPPVAAPEPTPPPVAAEPRPAPPPPRPEPVAPPREDPQIAIEKAKVEAAKKAEAQKREAARKAEAEREKELQKERDKEREKQRLADEQAEKKKQAEKARQEEARQAKIREDNLKRMMAQAGASNDPAATGTAAQTSGPSAGYAGRIKARIKPHIILTASVPGNPLATVEVRLAPDGTIVSRRLTRSSGSPAWDETVLRAIDKTEVLPRDVDGRVPPTMTIDFRPQD